MNNSTREDRIDFYDFRKAALAYTRMLLRRKHAIPTEVQAVQKDDFVTLSCQSD